MSSEFGTVFYKDWEYVNGDATGDAAMTLISTRKWGRLKSMPSK